MKLMTPVVSQTTKQRWTFNKNNNPIYLSGTSIYQLNSSTFRNNIQDLGNNLLCNNVNQDYTVTNVQNKRGSFHGFILPYMYVNETYTIRVILDGKVFFELVDWVCPASGNNWLFMPNQRAVYDAGHKHYSYLLFEKDSKNHHQGFGESFEESLVVEFRQSKAYQGNFEFNYFMTQYYAEDIIQWKP